MAHFPTLKTGAVTQYPSERALQVSTGVYQFLDGAAQRFPRTSAALRRWVIRMELLDDAELFVLEQFFVEQEGAGQSFSFTDPWTGGEYANCSFEADQVDLAFKGVGNGAIQLVVRENR